MSDQVMLQMAEMSKSIKSWMPSIRLCRKCCCAVPAKLCSRCRRSLCVIKWQSRSVAFTNIKCICWVSVTRACRQNSAHTLHPVRGRRAKIHVTFSDFKNLRKLSRRRRCRTYQACTQVSECVFWSSLFDTLFVFASLTMGLSDSDDMRLMVSRLCSWHCC